MNIEDVKDLIKMVDQANINEVQVETAGMKVAIRKGVLGATVQSEQMIFMQDTELLQVIAVTNTEANTIEVQD